ncbi:MAG: hypothetical protein IMZ57_09650, partial [Acidobacteria bacterium]|nr:hypothetical protein [Acidobacteriota bacterium]
RAQQAAALSDEQVKARLGFITEALNAGQPRARTWSYGWVAGYSAGAVTMGVLAGAHWNDTELVVGVPVRDRGFAQDMLVGGATFALGVAGLLIDPFVPATAARKLRPLPEATPMERLEKLRRAEELLRQCARREKGGRSLKTHLMNAGVNAAAGVVTAAAFKRPWTDGLFTFATGEAVSLLNIFSQPMRATRDLKRYEVGYPGNDGVSIPAQPECRWSLSVWPGGLSFRLQF